jgi:hypothetical protein
VRNLGAEVGGRWGEEVGGGEGRCGGGVGRGALPTYGHPSLRLECQREHTKDLRLGYRTVRLCTYFIWYEAGFCTLFYVPEAYRMYLACQC